MKKRTKPGPTVICKLCGWLMFQVSREHAKEEVKTFNKYFDSLGKEKQEEYYGGKKSSIRNYEHCFFCGTCYHNFRKAKISEIRTGCTLSPIIDRKD